MNAELQSWLETELDRLDLLLHREILRLRGHRVHRAECGERAQRQSQHETLHGPYPPWISAFSLARVFLPDNRTLHEPCASANSEGSKGSDPGQTRRSDQVWPPWGNGE